MVIGFFCVILLNIHYINIILYLLSGNDENSLIKNPYLVRKGVEVKNFYNFSFTLRLKVILNFRYLLRQFFYMKEEEIEKGDYVITESKERKRENKSFKY